VRAIFIVVSLTLFCSTSASAKADYLQCQDVAHSTPAFDQPILKLTSAFRTYTLQMQQLNESFADYREVWQLMGPDYYYGGCKGGCSPGYELRKIHRKMVSAIDNARSARTSLTQLTSVDFVNALDAVNSWVIPNDAHDLQSGYPEVPSYLVERNPFDASKMKEPVRAEYLYLGQAFRNAKYF
jgi:hypothetical protein